MAIRPRIVRRTTMHCPHTGLLVEVALEMTPTGGPALALSCSDRLDQPPGCDQSCRLTAEAVLAPVKSLLILPPRRGGSDESI
jgi:hypothetical protein